MGKFNYDENSQLKTRLAILESQLNVANREVEFLKIRTDSTKNNSKKIIKLREPSDVLSLLNQTNGIS